jgi:hypothetical protein
MKRFLSQRVVITRLEGALIFGATIGFTIIGTEINGWLGVTLLAILVAVGSILGLAKAEK